MHDVPEQVVARTRGSACGATRSRRCSRRTTARCARGCCPTSRTRRAASIARSNCPARTSIRWCCTSIRRRSGSCGRPTSRAARAASWSRSCSATTAPVDGVQIAFSATVRRGSETVLERKIVELRINDAAGSDAVQAALTAPLSVRLLLSCGEPSGDLYAGALARELRALSPGIDVVGLGGPQFAAAGGRLIADYRGLAVTGLTEAIAEDPEVARDPARSSSTHARREPPDALVVIDFPDFNFRWRAASGRWASRHLLRQPAGLGVARGRLKTIREIAARVLVIFPFEEPIYRDGGHAGGVRRPSADRSHAPRRRALRSSRASRLRRRPRRPSPCCRAAGRTRSHESCPTWCAQPRLIRQRVPGAQFIVARAPNLDDRLFAAARQLPLCAVVEGETDAVLARPTSPRRRPAPRRCRRRFTTRRWSSSTGCRR